MYASVCIDISHEKLDKTFEYIIPDELLNNIEIGDVVNIPFGKGNRIITGFVLAIKDKCDFDKDKLKSIISIANNSGSPSVNLIKLAAFIRETYGGTMSSALKTIIPIRERVKPKEEVFIKLSIDKEEAKMLIFEAERKNATARVKLLRELLEEEAINQSLLINKLHIPRSTINKLCEMEVVTKEIVSKNRNPLNEGREEYNIKLNDDQLNVCNSIKFDMDNKGKRVHLLHGITGSGKTEVYIELIDKVIKGGKEAIVLIPEIALTYQTVKRFQKKFGNLVSIINSKLSKGEKYDQFERAKRSEIKIMIGPRSALFTPFNNLGLIIIDEEHERTYKSEQVPKYHAREVAIKRAEIEDAYVVLGSATPSIESYYKACEGVYKLHELENRANKGNLADVEIVDMREELKSGNKSMFSRKLQEQMKERLSKNQQTMIFLNRRGYANFVSCRSCGEAVKCPHCDVTLKPHKNGLMICHYCGHEEPLVKTCPKCGSNLIKPFGTGTEKVESAIKKLFPESRVLRMDADTTRKKDGYEKILSAFAGGEADILVGTQMIVKGHDFPNVTLVGIIAADLSLYATDFRASENTFALLTQAAGRAGRGREKGDVVIQTYNPDNYAIELSKEQDYKSFYNLEISYRKLLKYPPVYAMAVLLLTGDDLQKLTKVSKEVFDVLLNVNLENVELFGPVAANVGRISDSFRMVIYLKHMDINAITKLKDRFEGSDIYKEYEDISITFDMLPMSGY